MKFNELKHGQLLVDNGGGDTMWISLIIGDKHYLPNFNSGRGYLFEATGDKIFPSQLVLPTIQEIVNTARSKCK